MYTDGCAKYLLCCSASLREWGMFSPPLRYMGVGIADILSYSLCRAKADEFSYWNFFLDFGPLSLGNLFRFCRTLNFKLKSERLQGKVNTLEDTVCVRCRGHRLGRICVELHLHTICNVISFYYNVCTALIRFVQIEHVSHWPALSLIRIQAIYIYSGPHAHKRTNAAFLLSAWLMMYDGRTPEQVDGGCKVCFFLPRTCRA